MVVWPEYISLKDWAAALTVDYPNENIPILEDENKWQEWGTIVVGTGVFARATIPTPFTIKEGQKTANFENWQSWAKVFFNLMSSEYDLDKNIIV